MTVVRASFSAVRLPLAVTIAAFAVFGLAFAIGALAGWTYTARDRTCALVPSKGTSVPVCEYDYRPPRLWATS